MTDFLYRLLSSLKQNNMLNNEDYLQPFTRTVNTKALHHLMGLQQLISVLINHRTLSYYSAITQLGY
ncbi:hypothetical protein Xmau_02050 [Xenorhabdus mauleonii]|uniref:Uncharacterized protein n=1 Tax=Xenorhabdus mauleonii TaxID=351675 RepID=A0A1I3HSC3_9GAMM|nr:hypothetical protein Xmau_02050 [Xenorhabdus mauleonii]SFI38625.1 hypothetical protein SAMN05421680_10147 [Xenorhabdus mauleonii]